MSLSPMKPAVITGDNPVFTTDKEQTAYRAGLAEGFRRGVQAAVEVIETHTDNSIHNRVMLDRIRALRPEEGKT